ncbi:ABC transporter ATP-binding protein [Tistrella bauzanensis]|uniref:ABC transporter ATP-binding protein n=2 Tax=Tistrella bauzanensis TaxID=657419 RepID=A0ABQ1J2C2_9PROT|nr:ABC transporter ATP-binding protein [Tistrella bauzanensis]
MTAAMTTADRPEAAHPGLDSVAAPLLELDRVGIRLRTGGGEVSATRDVSFRVGPAERIGIVGESGCGKTLTGLAIMGLLPRGLARIDGAIRFQGRDLLTLSTRELRRLRGTGIAMIFQEPMSALDPVFTVGEQIIETILAHEPVGRRAARERAIDLLARVGIPLPARRADEYPHQLSGGMRQRAMIAIALACNPKLLIADEPTTALDVTIQAQIIDLLVELSETSGTALLFITHDLGVVAETCTRMVTMYAGEVVEDATVDDALVRPRHPYTAGLFSALPRLVARGAALPSIPGRVPSLIAMPEGCRFRPRCAHAIGACELPQALLEPVPGQKARCIRTDALSLQGVVR